MLIIVSCLYAPTSWITVTLLVPGTFIIFHEFIASTVLTHITALVVGVSSLYQSAGATATKPFGVLMLPVKVRCGSCTNTMSHSFPDTLLYSSRCAFCDLLRLICRILSLVICGSGCSDMGHIYGGETIRGRQAVAWGWRCYWRFWVREVWRGGLSCWGLRLLMWCGSLVYSLPPGAAGLKLVF